MHAPATVRHGLQAVASRWARLLGALAWGALAAVIELPLLIGSALFLLIRGRRETTVPRLDHPMWRTLSRWHARRLERLLYIETGEFTYGRPLPYLWVRTLAGLFGGVIVVLTGYGAGIIAVGLIAWAQGNNADGMAPSPFNIAYLGGLAVVLGYLALQGMNAVGMAERRLAARFLGPSDSELLNRRITELADSRAAVVSAVDDERRRIERDLHDGVQQRLVTLGMLIGRARRSRDPLHSAQLLATAHQESQAVLTDLREVAWRVYPAALDEAGLAAALEAVCERSAIPVELRITAPDRLPAPVETAAYFVVCEAVTNAVKHSRATRVRVAVEHTPRSLSVHVDDDGIGGATADGRGLSGLSRRVSAVDGRFDLTSPPGGPTTITVELPCA